MDAFRHTDGGADGRGFRWVDGRETMAERGTESEEHFDPLGGRNVQRRPACPISRC